MGCLNDKPASDPRSGSGSSMPKGSKGQQKRQSDVLQSSNSPLTAEDIEMRSEYSKEIKSVNLRTLALSYGWLSQRGYYPDSKWKHIKLYHNNVTVYLSLHHSFYMITLFSAH